MIRRWFNKLKVSQKLMLISLFFMMPDSYMLYMFITGINTNIQFAQLEKVGNQYQRPLEELLDLVPQHRLLVKRASDGDPVAQQQLAGLESQIDSDFDVLAQVDARIGRDLQFTDEALAKRGRQRAQVPLVRKSWDALKQLLAGSTHDNTEIDARHLQLIADIRTMITHSGDMSNLILDPDLDSYYLMDVTLLALPDMQDRLAQATFNGYSDLSTHHSSFDTLTPPANPRLLSTVSAAMLKETDLARIVNSTQTALNEDANFYGISPTFQARVPQAMQSCLDATNRFVDLTRKISGDGDNGVNASEYLAAGDRAREASFHFWRVADAEVDTLLQLRINDYAVRRTRSLFVAAAAFLAAVTLVTFITRSISGPLKQQAIELQQANQSLLAQIAERERVQAALLERTRELTHLALHDRLTGLSNRAMFNDRLAKAVERSGRDADYKYAVLFLDFDRFKMVNDSLGHETGDLLLKSIANRLENAQELATLAGQNAANILSARLGGDEFVVLIDDLVGSADASAFAEQLLSLLATPYNLDGREVHSTVSIGITSSDLQYQRAEDVLRDADTAMYYAKAAGKARFVVFDRPMHAAATLRLELESDLRGAIERNEFLVHFQPIVSLSSGVVRGFEALVRWNHPQRGLVPPLDFIPCCEEIGMIVPLGIWVMEQACHQLHAWTLKYPEFADLTMNVNLSAEQLTNPELISEIRRVLGTTGVRADSLVLEITESSMIIDAPAAIAVFEQIRDLGVRLYMDDFGSGYSSLSCLHQFPLDGLKIDRTFMQNVSGRRDYTAVVTAIVNLARHLDLKLIAEGIETPEHISVLRSLGCDLAQGYYYGRPCDAAGAEAFIAPRRATLAA
jgi:diguanylate cyclase (GGDEF)-like protein